MGQIKTKRMLFPEVPGEPKTLACSKKVARNK
jgi:hypothetical protein